MNKVHLQYYGEHKAKPVKDIIIGTDYFVWNYGATSKPIEIIKETDYFDKLYASEYRKQVAKEVEK